jgi:hypothetical protein
MAASKSKKPLSKQPELPKYLVGHRVYDGASARVAVIVEVVGKTYEDGDADYYYRLDDTVPLNPTGDKAFPDRWRNDFEICLPVERAKLKDFKY